MSPSADDFSQDIGRELQPGDILLIDTHDPYGKLSETKYFKVVSTDAKKEVIKRNRQKEMVDCIEVRRITPFGPTEYTTLFPKTEYRWSDIVRLENRTDPSSKERK